MTTTQVQDLIKKILAKLVIQTEYVVQTNIMV